MGGCYSCDESQQITWVCGSFHHQLQISIKTESRAEDSGGYQTSHLSLLPPSYLASIHPWLWLLLYNALNFSVSTHIDFFIMLSWSPSWRTPLNSHIILICSNIFLIIFRNKNSNPNPAVTHEYLLCDILSTRYYYGLLTVTTTVLQLP